jgi:carbamoyl-phosphate synthase large subunit
MMLEEINALSYIDPWFLRKIQYLVGLETRLKLSGRAIGRMAQDEKPASVESDEAEAAPVSSATFEEQHRLIVRLIREAKRAGFADRTIAEFAEITEGQFRALRKRLGILPVYKMVDTCAAEFEAATPYYYSCYDSEDEY